jgi:hypothetical protein
MLKKNDTVNVTLPSGTKQGRVKEILYNASFDDEIKYYIEGDNFITITSERSLSEINL